MGPWVAAVLHPSRTVCWYLSLISTGLDLGIYPGLSQTRVILHLSPSLQTLLDWTLPLLVGGHLVPPHWPHGRPTAQEEPKGSFAALALSPGVKG